MLLLDSPVEAAGLAFYRDHADPSTFHLLPGAPRLLSDGLELLRFRGQGEGRDGGLLRLELDLEPEPQQVEAARDELANRFGLEPNLVPVVFDQGAVRLAVLGTDSDPSDTDGEPGEAESRFVEQVLGTASPSLFHHQRAILSAPLTADGAVLVEAALVGDGSPLLAIYDLSFSGLAQARGLLAEVDYRMAYDFLRTRLKADTLLLRADLDREAEALAREGHLRITDVDYTGSDPAVLAERERQVRETLLELSEMLFFQPTAAPEPTEGQSSEARTAEARPVIGRGAFVLRSLLQHDEQTLTYDLRETSVRQRRIAPQGAVDLPSDMENDWLLEVDLGEGETRELTYEAFSLEDADWKSVEAVQIDARVGTEERSLVLSADQPRASAVLPAGDLEWRQRPLTRPAPEDLGEPPPATGFTAAKTRTVLIEPEIAAQRRRLHITLGPAVLERVERFEGRLSDHQRSRLLLLDKERPEVDVTVWGETALELSGSLRLLDGGEVAIERVIGPQSRHLLIQPDHHIERRIRVVLRDPLERYRSAFVEIEPIADEGTASHDQRVSLELTPQATTAFWTVPATTSLEGGYRYRLRTTGRNAEVIQGDWHAAAGPLLVVGDTDLQTHDVEVVVLPAEDLAAASLRLTSLNPPAGVTAKVEAFLEAGAPATTLRLPFEAGSREPRYRVEGELFFNTEIRTLEARETTDEILILPAPE
ncbi:MAG: hypothetical protein AAF604_22920 [Acidobacteriota bacterium]